MKIDRCFLISLTTVIVSCSFFSSIVQYKSLAVAQEVVSPQELYTTGLRILETKDYQKALVCFERATEKNPSFADAYYQIAYCMNNLGRSEEAVEAYKKAIRIKPSYVEAYYSLRVVPISTLDEMRKR